MPSVDGMDPRRTKPALKARILRAIEGGFEEVAVGEGNLSFTPTVAGAYRSEIRIIPHHLKEDLNDDATEVLAHDYPWVYSNAIYVR